MIIVYLSIALVVAAFIFLAVYGFRVSKGMQPTIREMADTSGRMQQKVDDINKEKDELTSRVAIIKEDVDYKKSTIQSVITQSKCSVEHFKGVWQFLREMPNPRRVPQTELRPEIHELVDDVTALWKKIRYWRQ